MGTIRALVIIIVTTFSFLHGGVNSLPPFIEEETPPLFENQQVITSAYRLPNSVVPTHYNVELQPILDNGYGTRFTAPGKVFIDVTCKTSTNSITLHALTLNILQASIKVTQLPQGNEIGIASFDVDAEKDFFIINLQTSLRAGGEYRIYIEFIAPVSRELLIGLYLSNYTASDNSIRYLAVTDLEATDARRVFPCFDEPHLKATYDVSIIRLPKYHSLSNMDLLRTENASTQGWLKDVYKTTGKMSAYLFCIAVSDFESEKSDAGLWVKPVRIFGPPPYMRAGAGKYSPNLTAKFMTALENYFRVPYTFPKMDKIAVPHFLSGAMENWGLNTYRLNRLLIEEGIATTADRISTAITLSHELVHQWFGNLVTLAWWDDLWLNEGFASYYSNTVMMDIGLEEMLPLDTLVSDAVQRAMHYDVTSSTHPIHYTVASPTEIRIMFDTITYSKGAAIVRMMNSMLGEPIMRNAVTAYLKKYQYSNAHQDDLFQVMTETIPPVSGNILPQGATMKSVMDTWTLQTGFPVVSAQRTQGSSIVILTQEKYKPIQGEGENEDVKWHIPISLFLPSHSQVDTNTQVWLRQTDNTQYISGVNTPWFIINPQQTGYYRVKYDTNSLRQITDQLYRDHTVIDPQTRSALIDDSLNLAYSGYTDLGEALNLTLYLKNERNLVPWNSFFTNMVKPYRLLGRTASLSAFKKYITNIVKFALFEIRLDPQPAEPIANATILRNKLFEWACNLEDSQCLEYSSCKFIEWMADPTNMTIIFPDLRPFVYCAAVSIGGDQEWNFALDQYRVANREITKTNLIKSLGCSKSSSRLSRLLDMAIALNSGIEEGHRTMAIQAVAGNPHGADLVLKFIKQNFSTIIRRFGASMISNVVTTLSNSFHKSLEITDLQRFIQDNQAALEPVKGALDTAIGSIQTNAKWMDRNGGTFRTFLSYL